MESMTPDNVKELLTRKPLDVEVMNIRHEIDVGKIPEVTSSSIFEPNSTKFHPDGLFSEEIFGRVTELDRFTTEAFINLNTRIIHPVIYHYIISKKKLFVSILNGTRYARFDNDEYTFVIADQGDKDAGTGYNFFLKHITKLTKSPEPESLRAKNLHQMLVKYKSLMFANEILVLPAGLRDIDIKSSRLAQDDINKIYLSIINLATGLVDHTASEDSIFDGIRMQLQKKVAEIYNQVEDVMSGKKGFLQKHYGSRKSAFTTRNVTSVSVTSSNTPDDPSTIKVDETMIPLFNTIKNFQPQFINYLKNGLFGEIFKRGSTESVPVTDPKSLSIKYVTLPPNEVKKLTNSDSMASYINKFKFTGFRNSPVSVTDSNGDTYWLILTYQVDDKVLLGKSVDELKELADYYKLDFKKADITPLTWSEAIYIASAKIVTGKHVFITRYPVLGDGSIYPSKVHVITTTPDKVVDVVFDKGQSIRVQHFPIAGNAYYESAIIHPSRMSGLGLDYDGDMISINGIWTSDGNAEVGSYLDSIENVIGTDMKLKVKADTDVLGLIVRNLSKP